MHIRTFLLFLGAVLTGVFVSAQGTFQDLDFERAIEVPTYSGSPFIWTADAFPGWTVYVGGIPQTEVERNSTLLAGAGIADTPGAFLIDGNFSAILGARAPFPSRCRLAS